MKKVLILLPAYNEEKTIGSIVKEIKKRFTSFSIIVIDDGSTDKTSEVAKKTGAIVIQHLFNLGDGAARQTGFIYALRENYEAVVHLDADGQHSPESIGKIVEELEKNEADIVNGSRFLGEHTYKIPIFRYIGMQIFGMIASVVCKQKITDPTSGFRCLSKRALRLYTTDVYPQHFPDADILITSHFHGLKIKEIPVTMQSSYKEKSLHTGFKSIYYIYKMFLSIAVTLFRKRQNLEKEG